MTGQRRARGEGSQRRAGRSARGQREHAGRRVGRRRRPRAASGVGKPRSAPGDVRRAPGWAKRGGPAIPAGKGRARGRQGGRGRRGVSSTRVAKSGQAEARWRRRPTRAGRGRRAWRRRDGQAATARAAAGGEGVWRVDAGQGGLGAGGVVRAGAGGANGRGEPGLRLSTVARRRGLPKKTRKLRRRELPIECAVVHAHLVRVPVRAREHEGARGGSVRRRPGGAVVHVEAARGRRGRAAKERRYSPWPDRSGAT